MYMLLSNFINESPSIVANTAISPKNKTTENNIVTVLSTMTL